MRKALLFAPMLMLLLTACGGGGEKADPAAELQAQYAAVASATMEADVTCHYDGEERIYTLLCAYTPNESTVTVLSPAALSGISATVADGKLTLSYEDVSLDAGGYSAAALSPVAVLPRLMAAAASGYVTEQSEEAVGERSCLRLACDLPDDESVLYTTWFDQETLLPLRSEVSVDGELVFQVSWNKFEVTGRVEETPADDAEPATDETPENVPAEPEPFTEAEEAAAYADVED
ncbi:MAG: hypothetical protein K2N78_04830 [Oscillospiraceae bacterium]|nr:hypothetical protein [Oscillospiraceae bacterium]